MLKDLAGARNEPHAIASDDATFFERSTPIRKSSALRRYFARFQPHQLKQVNGEIEGGWDCGIWYAILYSCPHKGLNRMPVWRQRRTLV